MITYIILLDFRMEKRDIIIIVCVISILIAIAIIVIVLLVVKKGGSSNIQCITSSDCNGQVCSQGKCVPCSDSVSCPSGTTCDDGVCKLSIPDSPSNLQDTWVSHGPLPKELYKLPIERIKNEIDLTSGSG
jgi:hypothetical protein